VLFLDGGCRPALETFGGWYEWGNRIGEPTSTVVFHSVLSWLVFEIWRRTTRRYASSKSHFYTAPYLPSLICFRDSRGIPKVGYRSQVRGHPKGLKRYNWFSGVYGFPYLFNSNYRLPTHGLATIYKRDQPTTNQPTTSRHRLSLIHLSLCNETSVRRGQVRCN